MTDSYNNDNGDIKGGRNDDHENVDRNCQTSQKLISSCASSPILFGFFGIKYSKSEEE